MNGQFPGPRLEIVQGDTVQVFITNNSPFDITIHFHGIEQYRTPWSDGTPGVSQRPIPPGESFLSEWTATQYGAYWYHAHFRAQVDDGLFGAITIHPNCLEPTPFSLISTDPGTLNAITAAAYDVTPVLLSDWNRYASQDRQNFEIASGISFTCYDSILINGQGNVNCWDQATINALTSNAQRGALRQANLTQLTAKG